MSSLRQQYNCDMTIMESATLVLVERQSGRLTVAASQLHDTDVSATPGHVQLFAYTELQEVRKRLCRANTGSSTSCKCLTSRSTTLHHT